MKILLLHRYFWPDTPPYASMLRSIGRKLVADGHDVTVLSGLSAYKSGAALDGLQTRDTLDGMAVHRVRLFQERGRPVLLRLLNMVYFPLRIFFFALSAASLMS